MTAHHVSLADPDGLRMLAARLQARARQIEQGKEPGQWPSMRQILIEVCRERQARPEEIRGPRRFKELFIVRAEAMRRMHDEAGYSLPQIGRFFSGRDHTSVLNAVRRARKIRARGE